MGTSSDTESYIEQIGTAAGLVWHTLSEKGPLSFARLVKLVGEPKDLVMQALGWLAREGKVSVEDTGRGRVVSLR